jgi:hypothetical protein
MMGSEISLRLTRNEVGQILDGLTVRAEAWEKTAEYLSSGSIPAGEIFVIEECSDPAEAYAISNQYRLIIRKITSQLEAQA